MLEAGKRLAVFSIRAGKNGSVWVRSGQAEVNRDGSLNLTLDVLPLDVLPPDVLPPDVLPVPLDVLPLRHDAPPFRACLAA